MAFLVSGSLGLFRMVNGTLCRKGGALLMVNGEWRYDEWAANEVQFLVWIQTQIPPTKTALFQCQKLPIYLAFIRIIWLDLQEKGG